MSRLSRGARRPADGEIETLPTNSRATVASVAITAFAALIVAFIAAITAQQRQKAQLGAEGERLDVTLESERERQRAEFIHDRQLHDLSELRTVLDDAATRLDKLRAGLEAAEMTMVAGAFHPGARDRPPHPDYDQDHPEPWDEVYRRLRAVYEQTEDLAALVPRLRIRFPEKEPVVELYEQATAVARRHPFSVDFVEEGATLDSTGRRLAEIPRRSSQLESGGTRVRSRSPDSMSAPRAPTTPSRPPRSESPTRQHRRAGPGVNVAVELSPGIRTSRSGKHFGGRPDVHSPRGPIPGPDLRFTTQRRRPRVST